MEPRRDGFGIILALALLTTAALATWAAVWLDGWAAAVPAGAAVLSGLFGLYGLGVSMEKVHRDREGNPIGRRD